MDRATRGDGGGDDREAAEQDRIPTASEMLRQAWEERSLVDLRWLVGARWAAVAAMLAVVLFADLVLGALPRAVCLYGATAALGLSNLGFWFDLRRFSRLSSRSLHRRACLQALVDIAILVVSVHFAGGVENPFLFLLVFHITIASVLFSPGESALLATFACLLVGASMIAERLGVPYLEHAHLEGVVPPALHDSVWYRVGFLAALAITLYFTAFLVGRICRYFREEKREAEETCEALRRHEDELERMAREIRDLLGAVERQGTFDVRYENPNLVACWEVKGCRETECPAHGSPDLRCWNMAARECAQRYGADPASLPCARCEVYRRARPDRLTELGESFNSVMELLQTHAQRAEDLRRAALEREKMAAIGSMAAGVAHEVGNPLASISSLVQLLGRRAGDTGLKDGLALVLSHVERISRIVKQLCSFARPLPPAEEPADLGALAEEALELLRYDDRLKHVTVTVEREGPLPLVRVDAREIVQVFVNLILNAAEAMPDGGALAVRCGRRNASVYVAMSDSGVGIPPEVQRRIFEPFFSTKPLGKGTGLGLSLCYTTTQRYGGSVDVESQEGKGSTFTVSFPIARE